MKRRLYLLALLSAFSLGRAQGPAPDDVTIDAADAHGVCAVHGTIEPGDTQALMCALDHAEAVPLVAAVETGSLYVDGWVLRATDGYALIALRNVGTAPVDLNVTRVTLWRAVPATPQPPAQPTYEKCVRLALEQGGDARVCDLWKREAATPAASTASAE